MEVSLNSQQQQAATFTTALGQHLLIQAGPGTGKTKVLVSRIKHLLKSNVPAAKILVLTFTSKACQEIEQRINTPTDKPLISTFHAFGKLLLKGHGMHIKPMSAVRYRLLLHELKGQQDYQGTSVSSLSLKLSKALNLAESAPGLVKDYQALKQKHGLYDHEDMLSKAIELLETGKITCAYQYLLVDEFQDATRMQLKLLGALLSNPSQLYAVGDPRQAIYAFRGSSPIVFDEIKTMLPHINTISLIENYRSGSNIIKCANRLFPEYAPLTGGIGEGSVKVVNVHSQVGMGKYIVNDIKKKIGALNINASDDLSESYSFKDFAILFRHHRQKSWALSLLQDEGIPYQVSGEVSAFEGADLKFLIATLRYLAGNDEEYLQAIISYLLPHSKYLGLSLKDVKSLSDPRIVKWSKAYDILQLNIKKDLKQALIEYLEVQEIKIPSPTLSEFTNWLGDKKEVPEIIRSLNEYETNGYYDQDAEKVTLTTIHSAKGLEFACVYILNFEADTMPGKVKDHELPEEKRLFYVALTRAKQEVHLLKRNNSNISPFYSQIKGDCLDLIDDPDMEKQMKRIKLAKEKRSQIGLL